MCLLASCDGAMTFENNGGVHMKIHRVLRRSLPNHLDVMLSPSVGLRINSAKHLLFPTAYESRCFGYASE